MTYNIDWKANADYLLEEFNLCITAKPMHNAIEVQLEKDAVAKLAYRLSSMRSWGTDDEIREACDKLIPRLDDLKTKLVFEILHNGSA